jgi:hypothetical protein
MQPKLTTKLLNIKKSKKCRKNTRNLVTLAAASLFAPNFQFRGKYCTTSSRPNF